VTHSKRSAAVFTVSGSDVCRKRQMIRLRGGSFFCCVCLRCFQSFQRSSSLLVVVLPRVLSHPAVCGSVQLMALIAPKQSGSQKDLAGIPGN
jgi:hypothetical protein